MKYINDLTYLSHIAQTGQLVKDKKQKNKYRQTVLLNDESNSEAKPEELAEAAPVIEKESDRRTGTDRRKENQERGRYIESRQNKNRRHQKELRIII